MQDEVNIGEFARSPFGGTCSIKKGTRTLKYPATDCGRKFDSSKGWSFVTDPPVCPLCDIGRKFDKFDNVEVWRV